MFVRLLVLCNKLLIINAWIRILLE